MTSKTYRVSLFLEKPDTLSFFAWMVDLLCCLSCGSRLLTLLEKRFCYCGAIIRSRIGRKSYRILCLTSIVQYLSYTVSAEDVSKVVQEEKSNPTSMVWARLSLAIAAVLAGSWFHFGGGSASLDANETILSKDQEPASLSASSSVDSRGEILHLPGLRYKPNFKQYSGYIDVTPTRHLFYWFVESQSDPSKDPVIFWTNGGPGCSSMIGFGSEHGPFIIDNQGQLEENPFSWNKFASVIYIEQPAGVGFSFGDSKADLTTGDLQVAHDAYLFITKFLARYSEFQSNPFYLSGESYAGHYLPQLTIEILKHTTTSTSTSDSENEHININLKGFLVGNPYVDPFTNLVAQVETSYYHGFLPKPLLDQWTMDGCKDKANWKSERCFQSLRKMYQIAMKGLDMYALDFPVCLEGHADSMMSSSDTSTLRNTNSGRVLNNNVVDVPKNRRLDAISVQATALLETNQNLPSFLSAQDVYRPCADLYTQQYLRRADVQKALHVDPDATSDPWTACSDRIDYSENDVDVSTIPLYQDLVKRGAGGVHELKIWIMSGDDDSVCATSGTQVRFSKLHISMAPFICTHFSFYLHLYSLTELDLGPWL